MYVFTLHHFILYHAGTGSRGRAGAGEDERGRLLLQRRVLRADEDRVVGLPWNACVLCSRRVGLCCVAYHHLNLIIPSKVQFCRRLTNVRASVRCYVPGLPRSTNVRASLHCSVAGLQPAQLMCVRLCVVIPRSVLRTAPPSLLQDIILVDDGSDPESCTKGTPCAPLYSQHHRKNRAHESSQGVGVLHVKHTVCTFT